MLKLAAASLLVLSLGSAATGGWAPAMAGACPRCLPAAPERAHAGVAVPERAVVYTFAGEFATRTQWWLIDLDTGQITERDWVSGQTAAQPARRVGKVEGAALASLRAAAARLWRSNPPRHPGFAPGTVEEAFVISGPRMAAFSQFNLRDDYMFNALKAAVKSVDGGAF